MAGSKSVPPAAHPPGRSTPAAVVVMAEVGIDISAQNPKILTVDAVRASDVVITMGCGDTCPVFPRKVLPRLGPRRPRRQGIDAVRLIRDEIRARWKLIAELAPASRS